MGRMRENPRYNVISMRISDEEREHLESLMDKTHKSVSDIMREAMEYFTAHHGQGMGAGTKKAA
jgi:predicted DNA-binding protein